MKIISSKQMYEADKATLLIQNISSTELMERAAKLCFDWIHNKLKGRSIKVLVFCGVGNNGGDGLVIARHLLQQGYNVSCYVVNFSENRTDDFLSNYNKLKELGEWPTMINSECDFPSISKKDFVVDAIFGIGLKRSVKDFTASLILKINTSKAYTLAIDVPSGMFVDSSNNTNDVVIEAAHTLSFQLPKLAFFLPQNQKYINTWEIVDIALDQGVLGTIKTTYFFTEIEDVKRIYKVRSRFSHKGTFGHSLIIGGSYGKIGAVVLASKAALKAGSGLVTAYVPKCGYEIMQVSIPEIMTEVDADSELQYFNYKSKPTVIGIGPGIGTSEKTIRGFSKFLKENTLPLVLDADALNILALHKNLLNYIPANSVLTPHPKEFERLVGPWKNDYEKLKLLIEFSSAYKVIVVLKGAYSIIAKNENLYFNSSGNSALATAGSGDVLTGIITALIAQKYNELDAAIMGVYLHGLTANIGIEDLGEESFTASDIIAYLGDAFKSLKVEYFD